jgi:hypothetical protein
MIDEENREELRLVEMFVGCVLDAFQPCDLSSIYTREITSIEVHDIGEKVMNLQKTAVKLMIFAP